MEIKIKNIILKVSEKGKTYANCDVDIKIDDDLCFTINNLTILLFPIKIYFPKDWKNKMYFQSDRIESALHPIIKSEFESYLKYYDRFKTRQLYRLKASYRQFNISQEEQSFICRTCLKKSSCDNCKYYYRSSEKQPKHNLIERIQNLDELFKQLNLSVETYHIQEGEGNVIIEFSKSEHQFKIMKVMSMIFDDIDEEEILEKIPKEYDEKEKWENDLKKKLNEIYDI